MTYLRNASEPPDAFVSGYDCQDDCGVESAGGTGCGSLKEPKPSSVCLRVSTEISLESTGFGAQNGPQLHSLPSIDSCVKRAKLSSSVKSWFVHDQGLGSVHRCPGLPKPSIPEAWASCSLLFLVGFLDAVATENPEGLPMAVPF